SSVELHDVNRWELPDPCRQLGEMVGRGVRAVRAHQERVGEGVLIECGERLAEAGLPLKLLEALRGGDELDLRNVAPLANTVCELLRLGLWGLGLQEYRDLKGPMPGAGRALGVRDEHVQARRQRQRDTDDEHRQKGRKLLLRQPAERAHQRLQMPREPRDHEGAPCSRSSSLRGSSSGAASSAAALPGSTMRPFSSRMRRTGKRSSKYKS